MQPHLRGWRDTESSRHRQAVKVSCSSDPLSCPIFPPTSPPFVKACIKMLRLTISLCSFPGDGSPDTENILNKFVCFSPVHLSLIFRPPQGPLQGLRRRLSSQDCKSLLCQQNYTMVPRFSSYDRLTLPSENLVFSRKCLWASQSLNRPISSSDVQSICFRAGAN